MTPTVDIDVLREKIERALDTMRPYLKSDGGDVRLHRITDEMVVELQLLGSCETCEMSHMTMRAGLEQAIKRTVPEVAGVVAVDPA